jgi:hypothetical protein
MTFVRGRKKQHHSIHHSFIPTNRVVQQFKKSRHFFSLLACSSSCFLRRGLGRFRTGRDDFPRLVQNALKVVNGALQTQLDIYLGFPVDLAFGRGNVRSTLAGIIFRRREFDNSALGLGQLFNVLGELLNGKFLWIAQIDRIVVLAIHQRVQAVDQVRHVLEGPGLLPFPVNGHVPILQRLDDKVADNTSVVGVHARTERVEDTGDTDLHLILIPITVHHRFGDAFALVVTRPGPDRVDIAPVTFRLWMYLRITVNFRRTGEQDAGLDPFGQTEHIECAFGRCFDRLDGIVLVMGRGRGTGQMVNLVDFEHDMFRHIVLDETVCTFRAVSLDDRKNTLFQNKNQNNQMEKIRNHNNNNIYIVPEIGMVQPMSNVLFLPREEIIERNHLVAFHH